MSAVRKRLVELARSLDGSGMATDRDPERYTAFIGAGETSARALEMSRMYGCALTVRQLWRAVGVRHPILLAPYRTQMAVSDLVEIARASDALVDVRAELPALTEGDVVIVGGGPEYGGGWHAWTVLDTTARDYPTKGTHLIRGLDGGQEDTQKRQYIAAKTHEIAGAPPIDDGRRVRWVIDFGAVWRRWGAAA